MGRCSTGGAQHPAFAVKWDAALAFAQARFQDTKGPKARRALRQAQDEPVSFRTTGGEMAVVRRNDGKLQMRRAQPGKLTREAEQAFLAALSATCNMSLAAAAVWAPASTLSTVAGSGTRPSLASCRLALAARL